MRIIEYLGSGVENKLQFIYDRELVKFAVFAIPSTWSFHSATQIDVEQISEHFYPAFYLNKIETD